MICFLSTASPLKLKVANDRRAPQWQKKTLKSLIYNAINETIGILMRYKNSAADHTLIINDLSTGPF